MIIKIMVMIMIYDNGDNNNILYDDNNNNIPYNNNNDNCYNTNNIQ